MDLINSNLLPLVDVLVFSELFTLLEAVVDPPGYYTLFKLQANVYRDLGCCGGASLKRIEIDDGYLFKNLK